LSVMTSKEPSITLRISKTIKISEGCEPLAEKIFNVTAKKRGGKTSSKKNTSKNVQKGVQTRVVDPE
jgi:hypothetical protein